MGPLLLTAVLATRAPVRLRAQPSPARRKPRRLVPHLVVFRLGEAWAHGVPSARHPALQAHGRYVDRLFDEGTLVIAGPLLNDSGVVALDAVTGAVFVLRAATSQEARSLAEADPAVRAGLLEVSEVRRWGVSLSRCE
jgi:uncharacterized protein YciI